MKQSKLTKAMALMLSMTMITSVFVGNTLSRYVTSVNSTDNARVAVWGINAGEDTVMNLFSEDYIVAGKTIAASNVDSEKIMAPGTKGEAEFEIINFEQNVAPEVAYEVKISLDDSAIADEIKNNQSVQWKLDDGAYGTWDELKTSILSLSGNAAGRHVYGPGEFATAFQGTQNHKIAWQWVMDNNNNVMDTQMGNAAVDGKLEAVIKVSITAQQVDDLITNEYILDGADQTVNLNEVEPITIRSSADFSTFERVEVEGQPLTRDVDYTVESGSTVVTLTEDYLSNLAAGSYTIDIISNDVTATTKFKMVREDIHVMNIVSGMGYIYLNDVSEEQHDIDVSLTSDIIEDFSTVEITRVGKNLWDKNYASNSSNWDRFNNYYYMMPVKVGKGNKVTISYKNDITEDSLNLFTSVMLNRATYGETWLYNMNTKEKNRVVTFTAIDDYIYVKTSVPTSDGGSMHDDTFNLFNEYINDTLQIEIGTVETDFTPYMAQIVTAKADGSIDGITSVFPNMSIYTNTEDVLINVKYETNRTVSFASKLFGKSLVACGDSITQGINPDGGYFKSYAELVADKHYMIFANKGISGSTMAYNEDGSSPISTYAFSNTRYKELPKADYITLWFGWNDASYSELGTIDDTDNTTFYGAYKIVLDYLKANNPNAKIALVVPYGNSQVTKYQKAVRELAELYNLPSLDMTGFDRETYTYDNCHPDQAGHEYLSEIYEAFLLSL